eukprot:2154441-Rhodomonas_salina.1
MVAASWFVAACRMLDSSHTHWLHVLDSLPNFFDTRGDTDRDLLCDDAMFAWKIWRGMVVLGADGVDLKGSEGPDGAVCGGQGDYVGQEEKLVQSVREECDLIVERHRRKRVLLPCIAIRMLLLLFLVLVASSILLRALL